MNKYLSTTFRYFIALLLIATPFVVFGNEDLPLGSDAGYGLPFSGVTSNEGTANSVAKIIKQAILFTGVFAVMALTYGGILMTLSYGDDGKVKGAKNIIMYALIGVLLAAAAYAIIDTIYSITI